MPDSIDIDYLRSRVDLAVASARDVAAQAHNIDSQQVRYQRDNAEARNAVIRSLQTQVDNLCFLVAQMTDCLVCPAQQDCLVKQRKFESMGDFQQCVLQLKSYISEGNPDARAYLSCTLG